MKKRKIDPHMCRKSIFSSGLLQVPLCLSISFILGYVLSNLQSNYRSWMDCSITLGDTKYKGTQYTTKATLGKPKCLIESKFLKVQQHRVQLEGTTDVIEDWLWIDYHDRINVLIEAPSTKFDASSNRNDKKNNIDSNNPRKNSDEPHFIILQQTKYALEGRTSLAIVGGIIEPGESPDEAAKREVWEETGHICDQLDFLGRYRTDVNRGMGWTNTYVARSCTLSQKDRQSSSSSHQNSAIVDEVGHADTEQQKLITMSFTKVREAVMAGNFLEIQWSATVALALLLYEKEGVDIK